MSPIPATVKGSDWMSFPISRKCRLTHSQPPRAVIPSSLWSYPCEPPEAKASPSQKPYSAATALAVSERCAVPLSAATTRYGSSPSWRTTPSGGTTRPSTKLSVTSRRPRISVRYCSAASCPIWSRSAKARLVMKPPLEPEGTMVAFLTTCVVTSPRTSVRKSSGRSDQRMPPRETGAPRRWIPSIREEWTYTS